MGFQPQVVEVDWKEMNSTETDEALFYEGYWLNFEGNFFSNVLKEKKGE